MSASEQYLQQTAKNVGTCQPHIGSSLGAAWCREVHTFLVWGLDYTMWMGVQGMEVGQVCQLHSIVQGGGPIAIPQGPIRLVLQQHTHHACVLLLGSQVEASPFLICAGIHLCSRLR